MVNTGDDLTLTNTGPTTILLETASLATNGTVTVFIKPRNGNQTNYQARLLGGTINLATWQLQTNLPLGHFVIQARAVTP
ncbi:MAG: hypothetical protein SGI88_22145 [Candidatus Hydrogenedentes bacterium]|nr:hypothetical protein [Candidatus Hydrogenedentota bacterium]